MNTQLSWCPCIDDQTRIDFAHATVQDIQKKHPVFATLNLVSLGSGALKQEELIVRLLTEAGYKQITLNLIDPLYISYTPISLKELEQQVTQFESTEDFKKLGDLYVSLEHTDSPDSIKKIEESIDKLEHKMQIKEYVALCDQQTTLFHPERLELLQKFLPSVTINSFTNAYEYLKIHKSGPVSILLFIDPETRSAYITAQHQAFIELNAYIELVYSLNTKQSLAC